MAPTHRTLIYGTTGSGKSSPLLSTIYQMQRFVEQERVNLYGIDPTSADIRVFEEPNVFENIALDADDQIDLINDLHCRVNERGRNAEYDLTQGETGQSFNPTKPIPWNILLVDELFGLKNDLGRSREGKAACTGLENILPKGRSNGYGYSGIGYVMEDGGSPLKVRFAYLSSDPIAKFVLEYPSEAEESKRGAEP